MQEASARPGPEPCRSSGTSRSRSARNAAAPLIDYILAGHPPQGLPLLRHEVTPTRTCRSQGRKGPGQRSRSKNQRRRPPRRPREKAGQSPRPRRKPPKRAQTQRRPAKNRACLVVLALLGQLPATQKPVFEISSGNRLPREFPVIRKLVLCQLLSVATGSSVRINYRYPGSIVRDDAGAPFRVPSRPGSRVSSFSGSDSVRSVRRANRWAPLPERSI